MRSILFMNSRNRTSSSEYVGPDLYLYFSGLSLRRTAAERISYFVKRNHVSIWNWIQKYNPRKISVRLRKISGYIIIDETLVQVGSESIWLWVGIDRVQNQENSDPKYIKREKYACCRREIYCGGGQGLWKTPCFN
jgi:hypothetical protein